jgi:hypothetical protein
MKGNTVAGKRWEGNPGELSSSGVIEAELGRWAGFQQLVAKEGTGLASRGPPGPPPRTVASQHFSLQLLEFSSSVCVPV